MAEPHVVITIEAAFPVRTLMSWHEDLSQVLQDLRGQGAARITKSEVMDHDPFEDPEWRDKMINGVKIGDIEIDLDNG